MKKVSKATNTKKIDRTFGATGPLVLPTTAAITPAQKASVTVTTEVNYASNPADQVSQPEKGNSASLPAAQASPISPEVKLDPQAQLCQLVSYQYVAREFGSDSYRAQRFFRPLRNTGYLYALWLANSKPTLAALHSTELAQLLATSTMQAVWRRVTYGAQPGTDSSSGETFNPEIITDVPGLITHSFHVEYANLLQSRLHLCQRQPRTQDNWSKACYCNHATCQIAVLKDMPVLAAAITNQPEPEPASPPTLPAAPLATTLCPQNENKSASEVELDFAFSVDLYQLLRLFNKPFANRLASEPKERREQVRLAVAAAFTRLSLFQRQAITDEASGYSACEIASRYDWTVRRTNKHLIRASRVIYFELSLTGIFNMPLWNGKRSLPASPVSVYRRAS